jgi:plasmid stabilization system protein ParE
MKYHVRISEVAAEQIDEAHAWLAERTVHAQDWHDDLMKAIASLEDSPLRCPRVPEKEDDSGNIRQLIFGGKWHGYRIIFKVEGDAVIVLQVRHGARNRPG